MIKRPIIIDTDPGIDDAVALGIAAFSEALDVKLISTVAGNVPIDKVTNNALKLLNFFGKDIPVAMGSCEPLLEEFQDASHVHGVSGMCGFEFPEPKKSLLLKEHSIVAMRDVILNSPEPITIVPIGPMTNIALLLKVFPEVKNNIREIVFMGGSLGRGNCTVMGEFNIALDPEAAQIVMQSGLPLVMVGLEMGNRALIHKEDIAKIETLNPFGAMVSGLFKTYRSTTFDTGFAMYDVCAIAYLLKPEIYKVEKTYIEIELNSGVTRGCSVVDLRGFLKKEPNLNICMDIDPTLFKNWFYEEIKKMDLK